MVDAIIEDQTWHIYKITCLETGKSYIGLTGQSVNRRWRGHLHDTRARRYDSIFHKAIRKYGPSSFVIKIIDTIERRDLAGEAEKKAIIEHNTLTPHGYNVAQGGYGGRTVVVRWTPERKARMSALLSGRKKDRVVVEKIAAKLRGRKLTPEHAAIMKIAGRKNKGRKHSAEQVKRAQIKRRISWLNRKTVGGKPVGCHASGPNFRARFTRNGKKIDLGSFPTMEEASQAYRVAVQSHLEELLSNSISQ